MNPLHDTLPDIPPCPHCGHAGEGLQWAFPDSSAIRGIGFLSTQCACLACGAHGPTGQNYAEAIEAFAAGFVEQPHSATETAQGSDLASSGSDTAGTGEKAAGGLGKGEEAA